MQQLGQPPQLHTVLSEETNPAQQIQPFFPANPALLPGLPPSRFLCPHLPNLLFFCFLKMHFFWGYHVSSVMQTLLMRRGWGFFWLQLSYGLDDLFSLSCFRVWGDGGRHSLRQIFLSPGLSWCLSLPPLALSVAGR